MGTPRNIVTPSNVPAPVSKAEESELARRKKENDDYQRAQAYMNTFYGKIPPSWQKVAGPKPEEDNAMILEGGDTPRTQFETGRYRRRVEGVGDKVRKYADVYWNAEENTLTVLHGLSLSDTQSRLKDFRNATDFMAKQGVGKVKVDYDNPNQLRIGELVAFRDLLIESMSKEPPRQLTLGPNIMRRAEEYSRGMHNETGMNWRERFNLKTIYSELQQYQQESKQTYEAYWANQTPQVQPPTTPRPGG